MTGDQRPDSAYGLDRAPYPLRTRLPRLLLPRLAERPGPDRPEANRPGAGRLLQVEPVPGGWLVTVEGGDHVRLLDARLRLRRQIGIPTPVDGYVYPHVAADATCSIFAVSHRTGLRVFIATDGEQPRLLWEARHEDQPWYPFSGSRCVIDPQSRVWWARPDESRNDRIVVSDARTGTTIAEGLIEQLGCQYIFALHPAGHAAILDGAAGQDGSFLWQMILVPSELSIDEKGNGDQIMGGFTADGRHFVTAPHHGETLSIHRWPGGTVVDSIHSARVFLNETEIGEAAVDRFGFHASFLGERHVIADTRQGRLLLFAVDPLTPIAELWPGGYAIRGYDAGGQPVDRTEDAIDYEGELTGWVVVGNQLLTMHQNGSLHLWDLSSAPWR